MSDWDALEPIDKYMMAKLANLLTEVEEAYDNYKFNAVYRVAYDFVNDLSSVYMDVTKDRLYSEAPNSPRRRAVQTVLENILDVLVRVLSPILSFTSEEVWECYPDGLSKDTDRPISVQLAGWPSVADFTPALPADKGKDALESFSVALEVRDVVTKALEDARVEKFINKSQEAAVVVTIPDDMAQALAGFGESTLEELFITSGVSICVGDNMACEVKHAQGQKCPRCWNYRELGVNDAHAEVCERCANVLDELGFVEE